MPKNSKIVFLIVPILLYIGFIVCLAVNVATELIFLIYFVWCMGLPLLMIILQKESLRQRFGLGGARPCGYSLMFFVLVSSSIVSVLLCYLGLDTQVRNNVMIFVIFAPFAEEIFFRGYIQGNFEKFFKSTKNKFLKLNKNKKAVHIAEIIPIFLTALLFCMAHFKVEYFSSAFIGYFIFGIIFGGIMALTKSITFPISAHMFWNSLIMISVYNITFISVLVQLSIGLIGIFVYLVVLKIKQTR